ncbi:hypothetical protein HY642_03465 [Candidatus Woesearchaeota archaeon]|nr:hypothetical protein [Candidatus Woesearchaeota archaeon]
MAVEGFIQAKLDEGRLIAALGLERRILENGVLPNAGLNERASLVKGIITGLLEKGRWGDALRMVYTPGPARSLFDGDWEGFKAAVKHAATSGGELGLAYGQEIADILVHNWTPEDIVELITTSRIKAEHVMMLIDKLPLDAALRSKIYLSFGEQSLEGKEYYRACAHFNTAGAPDRINSVRKMLFDQLPGDAGLYLLELCTRYPDGKELLQKAMPKLLQSKGIDSSALYNAIKEFGLEVDEKELQDSRYDAVSAMSASQIGHSKDEKEKFMWAKVHAPRESMPAYKIFKELGYHGIERHWAMMRITEMFEQGWTGMRHAISNDIDRVDLEEHFTLLPLEAKVACAEHWKDKKIMENVSAELLTNVNESAQASDAVSLRHLEQAYQLAFDAELGEERLEPLRQRIFTAALTKARHDQFQHCAYSYFGNWIRHEDNIGLRAAYELMLDHFPPRAYEIARLQLRDEALQARAREAVVTHDPIQALSVFPAEDVRGRQMAVHAVADAYHIDASVAMNLLGWNLAINQAE